MAPRRVVVTLEIETAEDLRNLASHKWWQGLLGQAGGGKVLQAEANVVREDSAS